MFESQLRTQVRFVEYNLGLVELIENLFKIKSSDLRRNFDRKVDNYPTIPLFVVSKLDEIEVKAPSSQNYSTNFFDPVEWWVTQLIDFLRNYLKETEYKLLFFKALGLAEQLEANFRANLTQAQQLIRVFFEEGTDAERCQMEQVKNLVWSLRRLGVRAPDPSVIENQSNLAGRSLCEYVKHQAPEWLEGFYTQERNSTRIELFSNLAEFCFIFKVETSDCSQGSKPESFLKFALTYRELSKLSTLGETNPQKLSELCAILYSGNSSNEP
ncbi:MAG: hypothetical protein NZO16_03680 [Deltaproteobacteria bacterium]|nr:hypothetical protein [Deltaproteobacteria bacterium]